MAINRDSYELIRHFGEPQTAKLPDFEWVDDVVPPELAMAVETTKHAANAERPVERFIEVPIDTRHGVGWVLAWASALAVIALVMVVLAEFAYVFKAEHALRIAARAGAMEATLPRATYQSAVATIERRLESYPSLTKQLEIRLQQNDVLVQSQFRQQAGDQITITLSAPKGLATPLWLRSLTTARRDAKIQARAEQQIPGRRLAGYTKQPARN